MREPVSDEVARNRWMLIQLLRIGGVVFVVLGILMTQDVVVIAGDANRLVGYGFMAIGLLDTFLVPQLLARKWRSPLE